MKFSSFLGLTRVGPSLPHRLCESPLRRQVNIIATMPTYSSRVFTPLLIATHLCTEGLLHFFYHRPGLFHLFILRLNHLGKRRSLEVSISQRTIFLIHSDLDSISVLHLLCLLQTCLSAKPRDSNLHSLCFSYTCSLLNFLLLPDLVNSPYFISLLAYAFVFFPSFDHHDHDHVTNLHD